MVLTNVQKASCGGYQVIVYNDTDADLSTEADLMISAAPLPFADAFASRGLITAVSGSGSVDIASATKALTDPKSDRGWLFHTTWIAWTAPVSGVAQFDTIGSACDTWLGVYTGTTATNLTKVVSNDDDGGYHCAFVTFNAQAGTTYQIMIGSRDYSVGPGLFSWTVHTPITPLPTITVAPADLTVVPGTAGSLCVDFQTTGTINIRWYRNGQLITGANQKCLQWTSLKLADLGSYEVELYTSDWTWTQPAVEIQFNSEGLNTVGARNKLADSVGSALIGQ